MNRNLESTYWTLRIAFFLGPFLAGADKFLHWLSPDGWEKYLNPWFSNLVGLSPHTFMYGVGIIEMLAGAIVLAGFTRFGGYLVSLWLLGIIVNLLSLGAYYDIALRDFGLALGAFALAQLTEARMTGVRRAPEEIRRAA